MLPRILRAYRTGYPDVELTLHQLTSMQQAGMLREGTIQVGLVRPPVFDESITLDTIMREPVLAVVPEDHRLAARSEVAPEGLAGERFILFPRHLGPGAHDRLMRLCHDAGFTPQITQEAVEMHTIAGLVAAGLGVSLVPASARHLRSEGVRYLELTGVEPMWELALACRRGDDSALVRGLLDVAHRLS